ncbi:MAG: phosphatidate cytidylyltransferase [Bacteroidales bacterium]|jgi:phosphatidate cytidylyltransferase|nr:phosphatidate cytidylyltransferase [Bacteroidales bacterium]MCI1786042.1 phosphatidate cytidylyltransferase [Bacteroidales bacterium]
MNNVIVRTLSGIGFIVVMLSCLLLNKFLFAGLIILILIGMMSEFYRMTMGNLYKFSRILAISAGVILFILVFLASAYRLPIKFLTLALVPIFLVMINSLYVKDKKEFGRFSNIYTGLMYIAVPLALSNLIAIDRDGSLNGTLLVCFFIIIWCSDIGAFIAGITLGQKYGKKLFPSISPKKSWIGFWGGLVSAMLASVILHFLGLLEFPVIHCMILAIIMDVSGVYGDLFESQWKRHFNVKDSGSIIPGHGGLLDRFDSTLFAVPFGAVYLILMNLI